MAKSINKSVNIYLNGKQVENSAKAIKSAIQQLTNEMNKAEIGSDKYVESAKKIQTLKGVLAEHN
jgi:mevalonate pyrophosphate decarboxylase